MKQLSGQLKKDKDSALKSIASLEKEIETATMKIQVGTWLEIRRIDRLRH